MVSLRSDTHQDPHQSSSFACHKTSKTIKNTMKKPYHNLKQVLLLFNVNESGMGDEL